MCPRGLSFSHFSETLVFNRSSLGALVWFAASWVAAAFLADDCSASPAASAPQVWRADSPLSLAAWSSVSLPLAAWRLAAFLTAASPFALTVESRCLRLAASAITAFLGSLALCLSAEARSLRFATWAFPQRVFS